MRLAFVFLTVALIALVVRITVSAGELMWLANSTVLLFLLLFIVAATVSALRPRSST